jgi:predicted TIM-barrel fold metal-dependent hydrolase
MDMDGVDVQVAFPTKALLIPGITDLDVLYGLAANYNDFLVQYFTPIKDRVIPLAFVPTRDLDRAVAELKRLGKMGFFRAIQLPNKPIWGPSEADHPNYNLPMFDPLWAEIQEQDLAIAFHVSTGMDPRKARGNGGAVINYAAHAMTSAVEPLINLCASGVLDRFPKLRFATIEAGIGWVPFALQVMDESYIKHHMWVRPKLSKLPSEFYLEHGFSSFQEDPVGLSFINQRAYENCFMWANDYPHNEGSWPHSGPAIERQMGHLSETQRVKVLGGNATRWLNLHDLAAKHATR